jgi:hypothetical protein
VKPLAAHEATPRVPLPNGTNCVLLLFGRVSTRLDRRTTLGVSTVKDPPCQAVVTVPGG